ncbi:hypothetical protein [Vibrio sp. WXL103]|uniref:hypothetical protein n=1 Tax=Vibrio sp. WXL103 TaxID=3450710 RepID=UPI003EC8EF92
MNAFDILAENKIRSWEKDKAEGKIQPKKETESPKRSSFEAMLFNDIVALYQHMAPLDEASSQYQRYEEKVNDLTSQLQLSMERQKMFINSQILMRELAKRKAEIFSKGRR